MLIAATMGAAATPAHRGTAYVVFEELPLERCGNRLPSSPSRSFAPSPIRMSPRVGPVTLIPASGEFACSTSTHAIRKGASGETVAENLNAIAHEPDLLVALDRLQASAPRVASLIATLDPYLQNLQAVQQPPSGAHFFATGEVGATCSAGSSAARESR
jgi:hypothetical protein